MKRQLYRETQNIFSDEKNIIPNNYFQQGFHKPFLIQG